MYSICFDVVNERKVGESCNYNTEPCMGEHTYCHSTSDVCVCSNGYTGSSGDKDCDFPDGKDIGSSCTYSPECSGQCNINRFTYLHFFILIAP